MSLTTKKKDAFVKRWRDLCTQTAVLDYSKAALANEVHAAFPNGSSGDYQYRRWIIETFEVGAATAAKLLRASKAYRRFAADDWRLLGGWGGVTLANSLAQTDSAKLLKACRERALELDRPLTYYQVRSLAFDLGLRSRLPGRPSRTETETKLGFLRAWVKRLYREHEDLPAMPEHVSQAMKLTKFARVVAAAAR